MLAICFLPGLAGGQDAPTPRPAPQGEIELTLPQVRDLAIRALASGQPQLARHLSFGLIKADPKSPFAYYTLARAEGQMGRHPQARRAARRAYRLADSAPQRFEAAEFAARISYAEKRPTATQLWLRRAVQNAPTKQIETQLGRDFARVRAENPLSFSIRGGLRPSNNVNNGADTAVQIIDGLPFTGFLSGDAQALSGIVGHVDASLSYRLRGDKRSRTEIGARFYHKRVALDSDARAQAPTSSNSDFASTYGALNLNHIFAVGAQGNSAELDASLGQFWSGGDRSYDFAKLEANHNWRLGDTTKVSLGASIEMRHSAVSSFMDSNVLAVQAGVQRGLENGDRLSFTLNLQHTDSDFRNARTGSATLGARYAFGDMIGPARVSAGVVLGYSDYPDYVALFAVPGGRQDKSVYANVSLFFPDVDYAGFAPTVQISTGRKFSNVSRFDTRELAVSLGVQSKF